MKTQTLQTMMITAAVSGLLVTGTIAQVTNPPAANPPATSPSTTTPPAATTAPKANEAKFISMQGADKWVFSKFKGTDVLGPDNAHIGDVSDLLFDKSGKVDGVIVGVGGFLGIGKKDVAIDLSAFEVVPPDINSTTATRSDDPNNIKLKVSWTKPGWTSPSLRTAPPTSGWASSTSTDQPLSSRWLAATRPLGPAPTTTAS